jgi:predicted nucleic acid-binding protein
VILDSNALSALARKDHDLLARLRDARRLAVTLISLGEYEYGISHSRLKDELQLWLHAFVQRAEVFCPDMGTLPHYASVRSELRQAGTPIPANDCWIAALVRQHGMPLLSRDQHFDLIDDVRRLEW